MKVTQLGISSLLVMAVFSFTHKQEPDKIWTLHSKIDEVITFEKSLNEQSEFIQMNSTLTKSVYPYADKYKITLPVIVKRQQTGFLPVYAEYYYSVPDSVLRYISYDWERDKHGNFFKKQDIWREESKKLKQYNEEYERIKSSLILQLGRPKEEDKELQKVKSNDSRGDYFTRKSTWETNEYHADLDMIFESMTYRIRMNYYWKQ